MCGVEGIRVTLSQRQEPVVLVPRRERRHLEHITTEQVPTSGTWGAEAEAPGMRELTVEQEES